MVTAVVFIAGCSTPALWGIKSSSPNDIRLTVAPQSQDVLVLYNEDIFTNRFNPSHEVHRFEPRVYWLSSWTNATHHRMPEFIDATSSTNWTYIPFVLLTKKWHAMYIPPPSATNGQSTNGSIQHLMVSPVLVTNALPGSGYYAIGTGGGFKLWGDGKQIGEFKYPPSHSEWGRPTFARVALTPFAVIADTVVFTPIIVVMIIGQGGGNFSIPR
jgi:hypothetical protein